MSQIKKKFIGADQVGAGKIDLENNAFLRGRNSGDNADVDILKINGADQIEVNSGANIVPASAGAGFIGNSARHFEAMYTSNLRALSGQIFNTVFGGVADLLLSPTLTANGDDVAGIQLSKDAVNQILGVHTQENSDDSAVSTGGIKVSTGEKTVGEASTGSIEILSGSSELSYSGLISIETGMAGTTSGKIQLRTGAGADANSQANVEIDTKRLKMVNGLVQFKVLAADPTDITYEQGDMYFNSASNRVRVYNGSGWQDLGDGPSTSLPTWNKQVETLSAGDISNGYFDLDQAIVSFSLDIVTEGIMQREGYDYTLSTVGGVTRVTFAGNWLSLVAADDVVVFKYQYLNL